MSEEMQKHTPAEFELSEAELDRFADIKSNEEQNAYWAELGKLKGFDPDTIDISNPESGKFMAVPSAAIPQPKSMKAKRTIRLEAPKHLCGCCGEERVGSRYSCDCANRTTCKVCRKCEEHCAPECPNRKEHLKEPPGDVNKLADWRKTNIIELLKMFVRYKMAEKVNCDCGAVVYRMTIDKEKELVTDLTEDAIDHKFQCPLQAKARADKRMSLKSS